MAWESLLKALPNWGKDIREDNKPDEPDFYLEEQDREMTQGEIDKSYEILEEFIHQIKTGEGGYLGKLERKGWDKKKIADMITKLENLRDKIQQPIPSNLAELQFKGSTIGTSLPRDNKRWTDWVAEVTNELYQDFSDEPTQEKFEVMGQFLHRLKGKDDKLPKNLRKLFDKENKREEFNAGVTQFASNPQIPQGIIDTIKSFYKVEAERTGELESKPVPTKRGEAGTSIKDNPEVLAEGKLSELKWKKGKGDLTPSAVKRRQKKRAADAPELTHTRQREMRGEGEVEYQDTIKRPARIKSNWEDGLDSLNSINFKLLIEQLEPAYKNEPLEKFKGVGLEVLDSLVLGSAGSDVDILVRRIDESRKGVAMSTKSSRTHEYVSAKIRTEQLKNNRPFTINQWELQDATFDENNPGSWDKLTKKRREKGYEGMTQTEQDTYDTHLNNVEEVRAWISEQVRATDNNEYKTEFQSFIRQVQNAKSSIQELLGQGKNKEAAQELKNSIDLDTTTLWSQWGVTEQRLNSDDIITAFNLGESFEKGMFVTFYVKYWELTTQEWAHYPYEWLPSGARWRPYYPTAKITEAADANTFPQTFKAFISFIRLFVEKDILTKYEDTLRKMMNDFEDSVDKIISIVYAGRERTDEEKEKKRTMQVMVRDIEKFKAKYPETSSIIESKLNVKDDMETLVDFFTDVIDVVPNLLRNEIEKAIEKVLKDEVNVKGKPIRVQHGGKSMSLKEKLIDLEIGEWVGEEE